MKNINHKYILNSIALIFSFSLLHSSIQSQTLNALYSPNGTTLWVVGSNGSIYRSPDAGQTYLDKSNGSSSYNTVTGYTNFILWIGGENGIILKSTNAGSNFTSYVINSAENITGLSFIDNASGWACTGSGKIYNTTDGGIIWNLQNSNTTSGLNKIKFINSSTGIACGQNSTIIKTTNGGLNWNLLTLPINGNIFSVDILNSLIFASSVNGKILRSTDGGNNWNTIAIIAVNLPDVSCVNIVNDSTVNICGEGGFIRKSTDKGQTFVNQYNPSWSDMKLVYFYSISSGWCLGNNKMILRTNNGGTNWYMPNGTAIDLSWSLKIPLNFYTSSGNVFYQSTWNKKEIFVTNSNKLYRSLDIGETWAQIGTTMPYGSISNSLFVSPKDTNIILVAIDSIDNFHGKVLRSTNYGQSWQITFSANRSSDGIPMAIDPNHTDTIYYGPTDSVMFRSTDFGLTWSPLGSYRFENNCSIKVLNGHSNIIIVGSANSFGSKGLITRSTDYGATWTIVDSNRGPYPEVPAISGSILDSVLYATMYQGNEGGLKRSTNLGLTWSYINIDGTAWGFDRSGDDPNVICYAPWEYPAAIPAYISYDRGIHFTPLPPMSTVNNFSVYFYNRNNLLLQQSVGFYKLKATVSVPIGIEPVSNNVPLNYSLNQNYPNPFNPSTSIRFALPVASEVKLEIFDVMGRSVAVLVNNKLNNGEYEVKWNAESSSSGVYFYKLSTDYFTVTKKMILLK